MNYSYDEEPKNDMLFIIIATAVVFYILFQLLIRPNL